MIHKVLVIRARNVKMYLDIITANGLEIKKDFNAFMKDALSVALGDTPSLGM
jgi:hypothetical protein